MIGFTTPAKAGLPEKSIAGFLNELRENGCNMHSVLLLRGNDICFERYWAPFTANTAHRMYSVTKSFVSVAIGCLVDEGKLCLSDRIVDFFPDKLPDVVPPLLKAQTVRDMLTMRTCFVGGSWFLPDVLDRTKFYFAQKPVKPAGTLFSYDSTGSYILGVLAERLSGMPLLDYLKKKVLNRLGGFENAEILKTPDGTPWGDSALICTPRALMNFARFVMNGGVWEGERLLSEEYLRAATSRQADNNLEGYVSYKRWGYGYQFWMTERGGYACLGMGGQYAVCVPDQDLIMVCTADLQLDEMVTAPVIFRAVFERLIDGLEKAPAREIPPIPAEGTLALSVARGEAASAFAERISGARFACEPNPMGIDWFRLTFRDAEGEFRYRNAQGEKLLPFGIKQNRFVKFPQAGYSDGVGNVHEINDFRYDCAASAGWIEPKTLQLRIQITDRYFGSLIVTIGFADENTVGVRMTKSAEDFLDEYNGWMIARRAGADTPEAGEA